MTRHTGPILVLLALLGMFAVRWDVSRRADAILVGEAQARATISALSVACQAALARIGRLPELREAASSAGTRVSGLPDLGSEGVAFASDDLYVYGLASRPHRDETGREMVAGFVLRAWPLRFGATGDLEYQIGDDGQLWEGQNRAGRSGTTYAFPPPFPEPGLGLVGTAWWPVAGNDHR